jgi:cytoskeletal protein CcmA (bactofilin family)
MNTLVNIAVLFAGTLVLFLLPLLPALIEYRRKSDALPLRVIQDHAGEIRHFSQSFRDFVKRLQAPLREVALQGTAASGTLPDGSEYILLASGGIPFYTPQELERGVTDRVVVCALSFNAPDQMVFAKEMHIHGDLQGGAGNVFRAVLAEQDVALGAATMVLRWMHVVGELRAQEKCVFHGRLSSDRLIQLGAGCSFERMNAPRIEFGKVTAKPAAIDSSKASQLDAPMQRFLIQGDLDVPGWKVLHGSVVASGDVRLRRGARVAGSVKSNRDLILEEGAQVEGSAICARKMKIGRNCNIHGPILAEHDLLIEAGACCGSAERPTTISAPEIRIRTGALAFGTVWAKEHGTVES